MWSPTHVQVTVFGAKGLLTKGKNGTNDAFVIIALGKEKFQTSVKQKSSPAVQWHEECELAIPSNGNTAEIVLTVLHQNFIGVDEFLGTTSLRLSSFDIYEHPKTRWYPLKSKPGQEGKTKYRGELEVRVGFTVKSGSLLDLSKKEKMRGSFGQLSQVTQAIGGSLMSLGNKDRKGIKKLASSVGHKLKLSNRGRSKGEFKQEPFTREGSDRMSSKYSSGEPDPGVISEDEDEFRFDELSHKSSGSSLNLAGQSHTNDSLENLGGGELLRHNSMKGVQTFPSRLPTTISPLAMEYSPKSPKNRQALFSDEQLKKTGRESPAIPAGDESNSNPFIGHVPSIVVQDTFMIENDHLVENIVQKDKRSGASSPSANRSSGEVIETSPVKKERVMRPGEEDSVKSISGVHADLSISSLTVHDTHQDSSSFISPPKPPVPKPRTLLAFENESAVPDVQQELPAEDAFESLRNAIDERAAINAVESPTLKTNSQLSSTYDIVIPGTPFVDSDKEFDIHNNLKEEEEEGGGLTDFSHTGHSYNIAIPTREDLMSEEETVCQLFEKVIEELESPWTDIQGTVEAQNFSVRNNTILDEKHLSGGIADQFFYAESEIESEERKISGTEEFKSELSSEVIWPNEMNGRDDHPFNSPNQSAIFMTIQDSSNQHNIVDDPTVYRREKHTVQTIPKDLPLAELPRTESYLNDNSDMLCEDMNSPFKTVNEKLQSPGPEGELDKSLELVVKSDLTVISSSSPAIEWMENSNCSQGFVEGESLSSQTSTLERTRITSIDSAAVEEISDGSVSMINEEDTAPPEKELESLSISFPSEDDDNQKTTTNPAILFDSPRKESNTDHFNLPKNDAFQEEIRDPTISKSLLDAVAKERDPPIASNEDNRLQSITETPESLVNMTNLTNESERIYGNSGRKEEVQAARKDSVATRTSDISAEDSDQLYTVVNSNLSSSAKSPKVSISQTEQVVSFSNQSEVFQQSIPKPNTLIFSDVAAVESEVPLLKKKVSLTADLKLILNSPSNDSSYEMRSPVMEQADENYRGNMTPSLHQRIVLGEEISSTSKHSTSSAAKQNIHSIYSDKSREELIATILQRDQQIKDLNDYIDSLLLRVMDTCPTVLQKSGKGRTVVKKK